MRLPFSVLYLQTELQHVFHEVNILEHNAELSTVKTVKSSSCQCQYKSLDGLKDVLMQDSIV